MLLRGGEPPVTSVYAVCNEEMHRARDSMIFHKGNELGD